MWTGMLGEQAAPGGHLAGEPAEERA
jgi:hypothetical protein